MSREELESNPELIGLLVMQNPLKKETNSSIQLLHKAALKTIMVTGDNLQTAIAVAKECHMIEKSKRVIQVVAELTSASIHGTRQIQVFYNDLMAASSNSMIEETVSGTDFYRIITKEKKKRGKTSILRINKTIKKNIFNV